MLPIDPTQVEADDIGKETATLEMEHNEAIERVREVCAEAGFGVPVEFSPSDLLNEKVDADRDPYYVLGACNPSMANRALEETMELGALFPCNVVIWEEKPGVQRVYHVSIMRIARLIGIAPDSKEWQEIVDDTGEMVEEIFDRL